MAQEFICPHCGKKTLKYYYEDFSGRPIVVDYKCSNCGFPNYPDEVVEND